MKPATEVFGEWAKIGKDEGMERGHARSVSEMLEFAEGKLIQSGKNSLLWTLDAAMVGSSENIAIRVLFIICWS